MDNIIIQTHRISIRYTSFIDEISVTDRYPVGFKDGTIFTNSYWEYKYLSTLF